MLDLVWIVGVERGPVVDGGWVDVGRRDDGVCCRWIWMEREIHGEGEREQGWVEVGLKHGCSGYIGHGSLAEYFLFLFLFLFFFFFFFSRRVFLLLAEVVVVVVVSGLEERA
jgi:hypothetical protein